MRSRCDWRPNWTAAPECCWLVLPTGNMDCLPVSILRTPDVRKWIPPHDLQRRALAIFFLADDNGQLPATLFGIHREAEGFLLASISFVAAMIRICERQATNRVLRDLEHKHLILIHVGDIAVCLPVGDRPKCPMPRGCDHVLRHLTCPLMVHASIWAAPETICILMSLLRNGLLWNQSGDQIAITC